MAFSGESKFANWRSGFEQGGKSNSIPNEYKIIAILITRAKIMVLWCFTKNQSKIFLNLLTQTIPTTPAIFPIKFNVLELGEKFQAKTSTVATRTKIQKLNARFGHYSYTIHYYKWHYSCAPWHYSLHYTETHRNGNRHWT